MKIDAHQHYWAINRSDYGWITPDISKLYRNFFPSDLAPHLAKHHIKGTILVQAAPTIEESIYILQLANQHQSILGVVGWVDIFSPGHREQYLQLSQYNKLVGLRIMIQDMEDSSALLHPDVLDHISYYVQNDVPLDLLVISHQLDTIISLLEVFPNMRSVIDHIGKPNISKGEFDDWSTKMSKIAQYENIFCKVSGMVTEADHRNWYNGQFNVYIDTILNLFGIDRIMFGSDWPVCLLAASYDEVYEIVAEAVNSQLSDQDQHKLFGLNAAKFYKLKDE